MTAPQIQESCRLGTVGEQRDGSCWWRVNVGKNRGGFSKYISTWHRLLHVYWVWPPQTGPLYPNKGEKPINSPTSWRIMAYLSLHSFPYDITMLLKNVASFSTFTKQNPCWFAVLVFFDNLNKNCSYNTGWFGRQRWLFVLKSLHACSQVVLLFTTDKHRQHSPAFTT